MKSNRDLQYYDVVRGRGEVNIMQGLELHRQVMSAEEQDQMRQTIELWVRQGYNVSFI